MIRTKVIHVSTYGRWGIYSAGKPPLVPNVVELEQFIAEVGYENIRQILVNSLVSVTRYTVLYEDGCDALPSQ